jgi:endoglucanase
MWRSRGRLVVLAASVVVAVVAVLVVWFQTRGDDPLPQPVPAAAPGPVAAPSGLRVRGSTVVDGHGAPVRLRGFNTSGAEYSCIEGDGIFDLPGAEPTHVPDAVVANMASWRGANTVRVPLNEQCWLGLGVAPGLGGKSYQEAIAAYVALLHRYGFVVVLDLHRSAPGNGRSLQQEPMPDRDHSVEFWRQVATAYKDDSAVVFDLFNEPWPFSEVDSPRAWQCWRDGGCRLVSQNTSQPYVAAGMNELVAAIRSTGARNVLAVGGIYWAEMLTRWLEYEPSDPLHNLIASFHDYAFNENCRDLRCYDTVLGRIAAVVPLYAGEIGPDALLSAGDACPASAVRTTGFSAEILDWLDRHGAGYTAWSWNHSADCFALVADDKGTPSPIWGREIRARLASP